MARFSNELVIDRSPADVFAYLADFENVPRWNHAIERTTGLTPGAVRVGSVFEQVRVEPSRAIERFEVTELDPPTRLAISGRLGPFDADLVYELARAGAGTRLTNTVEIRLGGPLGMLSGLAAGRVRDAVADNLGVLKRLLETG